jgi:putative transcriptional regulator
MRTIVRRRTARGATSLAASLAVVVWAATHASALGTRGQFPTGAQRSLASGKVLVAARGLPDPNFEQTVVLVVDYSREGAMGLVLNRRTDVRVARIFPHLKLGQDLASSLYVGGPVAPDGVLGLLQSKVLRKDSRAVLPDVQLVTTREPLEELLTSNTGSERFRVYLGYAGWSPGQLDRETALGSWHVFTSDSALVFDADPDTLWDRQIRRAEQRMASALVRRPEL